MKFTTLFTISALALFGASVILRVATQRAVTRIEASQRDVLATQEENRKALAFLEAEFDAKRTEAAHERAIRREQIDRCKFGGGVVALGPGDVPTVVCLKPAPVEWYSVEGEQGVLPGQYIEPKYRKPE
jgi:hypothetical protein